MTAATSTSRLLRALVVAALITVTVGVIGADAAAANDFTDGDDATGTLDIKDASVAFDATNATFTVHTYESFAVSDGVFEFVVDIDGDNISDRFILFADDGSGGLAVVTNNYPRGHVVDFTHSGAELTIVVPRTFLDGASAATFEVLAVGNQDVDVAPDVPPVLIEAVPRVAGGDRIATAIESCFEIEGSADAIVLARADGFADALAGGPLAAAKNGCLLLTPRDSLDSRALAEIQRVLPAGKDVYLLGGEGALGPGVATAVSGAGYNVIRLGGDTRFATALKIATDPQGLDTPATIFLATGTNFPDALGAGPAAATRDAAILLSNDSTLSDDVAAFFQSHPGETVFAVGGPAAAAMPAATPVVGTNRYDTSVQLAQMFFDGPSTVGVASGVNFPDALAGGAAMARGEFPMLLTDPASLPDEVAAYLQDTAPFEAWLFGGPSAVSDDVAGQIGTILVG
jgi:putative cell wall-binding protein